MVRLGEIKRKTVQGKTFVLKRKKSPLADERYVYSIEMNGEVVEENAGNTKEEALDEFEFTIDLFTEESDNGASRQENSSGIGFDPGFNPGF